MGSGNMLAVTQLWAFKTRNYEMIEWRLTMRDTVKLYHTIIES